MNFEINLNNSVISVELHNKKHIKHCYLRILRKDLLQIKANRYFTIYDAKDLIDRGLVKVGDKKVMIARGEIKVDTKFSVKELAKTKVIFEDDDILVVDKPAFITADEVAKTFKDAILLNRLDKETSGVMMFAKNEEFQKKAIKEFAQNRVYKEYVAIVEGKVVEEIVIDKPILTTKDRGVAKSKVDKNGKSAKTTVYPLLVEGNKSKIK